MQKNQRTRQILDGILKEKGISFDNTLVTSSIPAIIGLVSSGFGVSILFDSHLRYAADSSNIDRYSFGSPNTLCDFVAATRKGRFLPACVESYIELVRQSL
jgi:DNA-binding transcriptional LysR family regulator